MGWEWCAGVRLACDAGLIEQPASTNAADRSASTRASTALAASFQIKLGFRIESAVAESLVASPVAMAFDENGRLFVVEIRDYPNRRGRVPPPGRVRFLEGASGDCVCE